MKLKRAASPTLELVAHRARASRFIRQLGLPCFSQTASSAQSSTPAMATSDATWGLNASEADLSQAGGVALPENGTRMTYGLSVIAYKESRRQIHYLVACY
jgi:hypothetical protein